MDALFQEGQSAQTFFDADFEGLAATPSCISLIRKIVRNRLGLISARLGICNGICCVKSLPQIVVLIVVVARRIYYYY